MPCSKQELYKWHSRPGAFERLTPPWQSVTIVSQKGTIHNGDTLRFKIKNGPFSITWDAIHSGHITDQQFIDEQVSGPFKHWTHRHQFEFYPPNSSALIDEINYSLPAAPISNLLGDLIVDRLLNKMFSFRHRRTREDIMRHIELSSKPLRVAITGASGNIGRALTAFLTTGGHEVIKLVRSKPKLTTGDVLWSPHTHEVDLAGLENLDAIVHLAGESIAGERWSDEKKQKIYQSRVNGTTFLVECLGKLKNPPHTLVSASAIGIYGNRGSDILTEASAPGSDFLAEVCQAWETASQPAKDLGIRVINPRIGLVLDPQSGALEKLIPAVKYGFSSRTGSGSQFMSWIDMDDLVAAFLFVICNESIQGPVNFVSPTPTTNKIFMKTLGKALSRPTFIPAPSFALKTIMGKDLASQTALTSQRVMPQKLLEAGFNYHYADLLDALKSKL